MCPTVTNLAVWWPRPITTRPGSTQTCGRSSTTLWSGKCTWTLKLDDVGKAKTTLTVCLYLQDWKEKYVHENYSKIFEDEKTYVEQVIKSGRGIRNQRQKNPTSHVECFQIIINDCYRIIVGLTISLYFSPAQMFTGFQLSQTKCVTIW